MRSITTLDLQYAHRFYGFKGEVQYLHGHTGVLTIEVEDSVEPGVNMVFPCNEIQKTAWEVLKNFDHALILREDDPLLPAILKVYEEQGIKDGAPTNKMKGPAFQTELATAYPDCRLVVTKETMIVEGMIKIVYELLTVSQMTAGPFGVQSAARHSLPLSAMPSEEAWKKAVSSTAEQQGDIIGVRRSGSSAKWGSGRAGRFVPFNSRSPHGRG